MLKKEFVEAVVNEVQQLLSDKEISSQEVIKNNGVILNGIIIREPNQSLAPAIHIESYLNNGYERKTTLMKSKELPKKL